MGSLVGQLAESDGVSRAQLATGFQRWADTLGDRLQKAHAAGWIAAGIEPADLAVTLLSALQGGLVMAQVHRDTTPLETALNTILNLARPN